MLQIIFKKMFKNRWMVLCMLIGVIIASSVLSSIPIYTNGVLQKLLRKDLESIQTDLGCYPGTCFFSKQLQVSGQDQNRGEFNALSDLHNSFISKIQPILSENVVILGNDFFKLTSDSGASEDVNLTAMSGMKSHVKMIEGRYPADNKQGDTYEIMVSEAAENNLKIFLGNTYQLKNVNNDGAPGLKVRVVGIFQAKNNSDVYWCKGFVFGNTDLYFDYTLFKEDITRQKGNQIRKCQWYTVVDYRKITLNNIGMTSTALTGLNAAFQNNGADVQIPALSILNSYDAKQRQVKTILIVICIPLLIMLLFYLFMVAQLIVDEERNEIAVLKSRGASRFQIFRNYFAESAIIGALALLAGPPVGLLFSGIIGASNGFLEFVQRTALPVRLNVNCYLYGALAVGVFMLTMLVPAFRASSTTIVSYKQQKNGKKRKSLWEKMYFDCILLAVSVYGVYNYGIHKTQNAQAGSSVTIDPLLLLLSSLFILGSGLLFVRIFPIFVRLLFRVGRKFWKPTAYSSLLYVSRSGGLNQFLIIFLIFTVSVGIFSATAARTINTNTEERIKYSVGADLTLTPSQTVEIPGMMSSRVETIRTDTKKFRDLSGVQQSTELYRDSGAPVYAGSGGGQDGNSFTQTELMCVKPSEFGKIAWFKSGLLPIHWFNYLNVLTRDPQMVLLSKAFKTNLGVKLGDTVNISVSQSDTISATVGGFIDYWPSFNPNKVTGGKQQPYLIVGNFDTFEKSCAIQSNEVWIKKEPGATSAQIYQDIKKNGLCVSDIKDASQQIIKAKNDASLQGINGTLSLSFIMSLIIAAAGFLIFWIMSIRSRILQFGILRAMGLSARELIKMLAMEQVLLSLISVLAGAGIGCLTSFIFVPMLQTAFNTVNNVLPFTAVSQTGDYIKLFVILLLIFAAVIAALSRIIAKIKIDQALKLGED